MPNVMLITGDIRGDTNIAATIFDAEFNKKISVGPAYNKSHPSVDTNTSFCTLASIFVGILLLR